MPKLPLAIAASLAVIALTRCSADVDLATPRAYACDASDGGSVGPPACAAGWRCVRAAQGGLCVQDIATTGQTCVVDAECGDGFVCTRDQICRNPGIDGPYACLKDVECRPTWTCGPGGRCIDPELDAESSAAPHALISSATRLSPEQGPPRDFASTALGSFGDYGFVRADGRQLTSYEIREVYPYSSIVNAARPYRPPTSWSTTLPHDVLATGVLAPASPVALLDDGLWMGDGGMTNVEPRFAGLDRMAFVPSRQSASALVAWNDTEAALGVFTSSGLALSTLTSEGGIRATGPGTPLRRLSPFVYSTDGSGSYAIAAITDRGLYMRYGQPDQPWEPAALGGLSHDDCPALGGTLRPFAIAESGLFEQRTYAMTVLARGGDGSGPDVAVRLGAGPRTAQGCDGRSPSAALKVLSEACAVCSEGERVVTGWLTTGTSSARAFTSRCAGPSGERSYTVSFAPCGRTPLEEPVGAAATQLPKGMADHKSFATSDGRFYAARTAELAAAALTLDGPLAEMLEIDGRLSGSRIVGPARSEFHQVDGFGFMRTYNAANSRPPPTSNSVLPRFFFDPLTQTVRRAESWTDGGTPAVATTADALGLLAPPLTITTAPRPDGGETLLLSSFDVLMSADISPGAAVLPELPALTPRVAPAPGAPIRGVAVLSPSLTGGLVEGYVLTDTRLTFYRASSDQRWISSDVEVATGEKFALWSAGGKLRYGYRDGRIYSLPGRKLLAGALEDERVHSFASLCGRTYAATTAGLKRLEPGTGWVVEPEFAQAFPNATARDLADATLFVGDAELYWSGATGVVLKLSVGEGWPEERR